MILPKLHITLERWKWSKEYQLYVSNLGNFRTKNKQLVKPFTTGKGYLTVKLPESGILASAHRIVMLTWKPINNPEEMTVDHLDHNKRNNAVKNLEWVTREENIARAQADHVKVIIEESVIDRFMLLINDKQFVDYGEALDYIQSGHPDYATVKECHIKRIFDCLINAYNKKIPMFVENGFMKEKYNCKFSIIAKECN